MKHIKTKALLFFGIICSSEKELPASYLPQYNEAEETPGVVVTVGAGVILYVSPGQNDKGITLYAPDALISKCPEKDKTYFFFSKKPGPKSISNRCNLLAIDKIVLLEDAKLYMNEKKWLKQEFHINQVIAANNSHSKLYINTPRCCSIYLDGNASIKIRGYAQELCLYASDESNFNGNNIELKKMQVISDETSNVFIELANTTAFLTALKESKIFYKGKPCSLFIHLKNGIILKQP